MVDTVIKRAKTVSWLFFFFTFMGPCTVDIFKYNQQYATSHNDICNYKWSTCFWRFLRPSSGAQNCIHSIGCLSSSTNTRCCVYSFELLKMGGGTAWNMYSIYNNKYHCVTLHLVGYIWIYVSSLFLDVTQHWQSVPSSRVKQVKSSWTSCPLEKGPIICPETPVTNHQSTLHNMPQEKHLIYTAVEAWNHAGLWLDQHPLNA
jgi:hypothetical protein